MQPWRAGGPRSLRQKLKIAGSMQAFGVQTEARFSGNAIEQDRFPALNVSYQAGAHCDEGERSQQVGGHCAIDARPDQ